MRGVAGDGRGELYPGTVHVWIADLDDDAAEEREAFTSSAERLRSERSLRRQHARVRLRARGVLRELIALQSGADPRGLGFACDAHGKPVITHGPAHHLRFSVSHSGPLAVYAFARGCRVGVDVETPSRGRDFLPLAARAFGSEEHARLCALPPEQQQREFLRVWTVHEASAKCVGSRMWADAREATGSRREGRYEPAPWVTEVALAPRHGVASLAVEHAPAEVCVLDWNARVG